MNFEGFITSLELQYFEPSELLINTENPLNTAPPQELWNNIVPTILILDKLRECLGVPICLSSVYRAPDYNATIEGAAPQSLHQAFAAADISIPALNDMGVSLTVVYQLLSLWQDRWFESPVAISTIPVEVPAGVTPHAPLNTHEENGNHTFQFRGYIAYGGTYIHIDTRGINNS